MRQMRGNGRVEPSVSRPAEAGTHPPQGGAVSHMPNGGGVSHAPQHGYTDYAPQRGYVEQAPQRGAGGQLPQGGDASPRYAEAAPQAAEPLLRVDERPAPRRFDPAAGARYWQTAPGRTAEPAPAAPPPLRGHADDEDEDDLPFRPWLHPDPDAEPAPLPAPHTADVWGGAWAEEEVFSPAGSARDYQTGADLPGSEAAVRMHAAGAFAAPLPGDPLRGEGRGTVTSARDRAVATSARERPAGTDAGDRAAGTDAAGRAAALRADERPAAPRAEARAAAPARGSVLRKALFSLRGPRSAAPAPAARASEPALARPFAGQPGADAGLSRAPLSHEPHLDGPLTHEPGPWEPDWDPAATRADDEGDPNWDRLYADPDADLRAFAADAAAPAEQHVPEAPMMDARPARRDPAPSRTVYRLQRMWLTPLYQALLRKGVPAFVLIFGLGMVLQDEERRAAMLGWATDLRATVTERPEFMVTSLRIEGASAETEASVRQVLGLRLPVSSFDIELTELQEKVATVDAIASAALHVRTGGVLEVAVQERRPAVVWRHDTGIGTLDQTGHQVATLQNRLERPDLPLVVGAGAEAAIPEALRLYHAAGPIRDRVRGLIRVGERRWDLVVDPAIRVMLPAGDPVPALEQVVALHVAQSLLDRDITAVDLRNPARATVRMGGPAAEAWRLNLAAQRGAPKR